MGMTHDDHMIHNHPIRWYVVFNYMFGGTFFVGASDVFVDTRMESR